MSYGGSLGKFAKKEGRLKDKYIEDGYWQDGSDNEMEGSMIEHFVSKTCEGETCSICGKPATHKVGEEIAHDDPAWQDIIGNTQLTRHNFTAYVCCKHFRMIFGKAVPCPMANGQSR